MARSLTTRLATLATRTTTSLSRGAVRLFTTTQPRRGMDLCFNCGERGHYSANCPKPIRCYSCGGLGHRGTDCPHGQGGDKGVVCFNCGQIGHSLRRCTNPRNETIRSEYRGPQGGR